MQYKIGGGERLQAYDETDGQYINADKVALCEKDKENLVLYHYFGLNYEHIKFHFPKYRVHDDEYCDYFATYAKNHITRVDGNVNKARFFLTYRPNGGDKSKFLKSLGYCESDYEKLNSDIVNNTNFKTLKSSRLKEYGLFCEAKTTLRGATITTVWRLNEDLSLRLITMITKKE